MTISNLLRCPRRTPRRRLKRGLRFARQLNGPLTALLLYMGEIKQHSHQLTQTDGNRTYLQQVVENALQQTERVCAMMKQIAGTQEEAVVVPGRATGWEMRTSRVKDRTPGRHVRIGARSKAADEAGA